MVCWRWGYGEVSTSYTAILLGKREPETWGRHLYIRTYTAWYQLQAPAFRYQQVYAKFWLPRRLGQAVTEAAILRPEEGLKVVLELIPDSEVETTIGRSLSFSDVQANVSDPLPSGAFC